MFASSYEPETELNALIELASAFPQVTAVEDTFDWLCANESLELFEQIVEQMRDLRARYTTRWADRQRYRVLQRVEFRSSQCLGHTPRSRVQALRGDR
jgi:hypothetical protein